MNTEAYEGLLCDACKENIALETSRLSWRDKLNPRRVAKKSVQWVCSSCRRKIAKRLKK